jgi:vesicle-fusing ATPase
MGARFSNAVLQTLLVLFSRRPPKVCQVILSVLVHTIKLQQIGPTFAFIIATSSLRSILTDLGLSEAFDSEMRVPPISSLGALEHVVQEVELFPSEQETKTSNQDAGRSRLRL